MDRLLLSLLLVAQSVMSQPVIFTIERNGTTYSLNGGLCESFSCGADEGRGSCANEIYRGRPAHYCSCNLPFTGPFCDETIRLNTTLPDSVYADCALPLFCPSVYGNGVCNQECNTAECLFDGYECLQETVCPNEDYCRERFSDGICDDECAREECEFDGGDCFGELDTLPGQLMLRLSITAQEFMRLSHLFLFQLSRFLRATVVLSQDSKGPLIWEWNEIEGKGWRVGKGQNSSSGIEVSFSVDLTRCSSECLESISRVVQFIDQAISSKSLPLSSALSTVISATSSNPSIPNMIRTEYLILSMATVVILLSVLVGLTIQQRSSRKRTLEAPIWKPPVLGETALPVGPPVKKAKRMVPIRSRILMEAAGEGPVIVEETDDVNDRDEFGLTPLLLVIRSMRREEEAWDGVRTLLRRGAEMGAVDEDGWGVLHHALHKLRSPGFVRRLIEMGASTRVIDKKGRTVVHLATEYDDPYNLRVVLEAGAKELIDVADYSNRVPLSIAVADCHLATAKCLLEYNASTENNGDEQYDTDAAMKYPIHYAVQYNNKEHVRLLIRNDCRLSVLDSRERTPLHLASINGNVEMARILVDAGCPVDYMDDQGKTAEDIAAEYGFEEMRSFLIAVRGMNETKKRRTKRSKSYSSDGGYGSEESLRATPDYGNGSLERPAPLTPPMPSPPSFEDGLDITPNTSLGVPEWGKQAQLPLFNMRCDTPLLPFSQQPRIPTVLTPSTRLLHSSTTPSNLMPPSFPSSYLTPL